MNLQLSQTMSDPELDSQQLIHPLLPRDSEVLQSLLRLCINLPHRLVVLYALNLQKYYSQTYIFALGISSQVFTLFIQIQFSNEKTSLKIERMKPLFWP